MTVARVLLGKSNDEIAQIQTQAESVAFSLSSSISGLSQNTTFNRDDAEIILSAVAYVQKLKVAKPAATAADLPDSAMGFQVRRQPVRDPHGMTWGA